MKKLLKITALTVTIVILINAVALADVRRDETVYTLLNADGSVSDTAVVVRLSGGSGEDVTEYGPADTWKLLDGDGQPSQESDSLRWPAASITDEGLYYQVPSSEQAPVDVSIAYTLDGAAVAAEELAGKSGRLAIELTLANRWIEDDGYRSLLCQVTFTLPSDVFTHVEGGGSHVMVGHDLTTVATLLPAPKASVTLTADVVNLELEPITIQVVPGSLPLPEELEEGIDELNDGVGELDDGAASLKDGSDEMRDVMDELSQGAGDLADGFDSFARGIRTLYDGGADLETGLNDLSGGLSQSADGAGSLSGGLDGVESGMNELLPAGESISQGLGQTASGAHELATGVDTLAQSLNGTNALAAQTAADAQSLLGSATPGTPEYTLLMEILQLSGAVDGLAGGMPQLQAGAQGVAGGVDGLSEGFSQYRTGVEQTASAIGQLAQAARELAAGLKTLADGLSQSSQGFADYRSGVQQLLFNSYKLIHGSRDFADGLDTANVESQELWDGIVELADGVEQLNQSVNEELTKYLDDDETLTSFTDSRNPSPATQAFLLRTRAVRLPESESPAVEDEQTTLWQRILDLFR